MSKKSLTETLVNLQNIFMCKKKMKQNKNSKIATDFLSGIHKGRMGTAKLESLNFKANSSYTIPSGLISLQCNDPNKRAV